jgi:hypothetical protein
MPQIVPQILWKPFIHQNSLPPRIEFIRKSFRIAALAHKVREVLDR